MKNLEWQLLSNSLRKIYQKEGIEEYFEQDETYLKHAFTITEKLWMEQFNQIDKLQVIMISESPLFGSNEKYIYNINTHPSSFFYFQDLEAFPSHQHENNNLTSQEKKKIMLNEFKENRFLVLDIFPFALNSKDTKINYRNMNSTLYQSILEVTFENYLIPKLKLCLEKSDKNTYFLYRYKRLFAKTGNYFERVLESMKKNDYLYKIDTINGTNMSLDRIKLKEIYTRVTITK